MSLPSDVVQLFSCFHFITLPITATEEIHNTSGTGTIAFIDCDAQLTPTVQYIHGTYAVIRYD